MLSFPFPFPSFPKLMNPFPVAEYSFPGKGKDLSQLQPFPKLMKPFPVATFPGKGKDLSQLQTFLEKERTTLS